MVIKRKTAKVGMRFKVTNKTLEVKPSKGKEPRYYPAEDLPTKSKHPKPVANPPKIRASITAGTILIILAGRFRGRRAVCLKVLKSGLLLISGPYKINGIPLRRVNPRYVIATSTKLDVSSVDVSSITDEYFTKEKAASKEGEEEFFYADDDAKPATVSDTRKADQKKVDDVLLKIVADTDPLLKGYLRSYFTLKKSDRPHKMVF